MAERTCAQCGAEITTGRRDKRYCDRRCAKRYWDQNNLDRKRELDQRYRDRNRAEVNARARQRRADDPEAFSQRQRKYSARRSEWWKTYQRDRAKKAAGDRAYRQANRDKINDYMRRYYAENPARIAAIRHARYARKRDAPGFATAEQIQARVDYYAGKCWMCGAPWEHIDHVKPLAEGGSNWPANLRPACASCNCRKKATWPYAA